MDKKIRLTALLLALTLTLAACGTSNSDSKVDSDTVQKTDETATETTTETDDDSTDNDTDKTSSSEINLESFDSTIEDAIKKAKSNFDGQLTDITLDNENNKWVYKIELESDTEEYDVTFDVNTLDVINQESETEDDDDDNESFKYEDLVTLEEAIQTAKNEVDGRAVEISTEWDDDVLYYEVSIVSQSGEEVDVIIDAKSGDFVEIDD
ncbi:PepSY domain-containing protein [Phocicoccus pinnipedialis]|nr:PepSY domain-containing protein [Jeotgalicoccus pinnipedialis]MBP1939809.1 putative membrane protein YkoI [Jeotgalicoccus pinnipedialis]